MPATGVKSVTKNSFNGPHRDEHVAGSNYQIPISPGFSGAVRQSRDQQPISLAAGKFALRGEACEFRVDS